VGSKLEGTDTAPEPPTLTVPITLGSRCPRWPEHPGAGAAPQLSYLAPSDQAGDRPGMDLTKARTRQREWEEPDLWWLVRTAAPPPRARPRRSKRRICRLPPFFHLPRLAPTLALSPTAADLSRARFALNSVGGGEGGRRGAGTMRLGLVAEGGDLRRWGARLKACAAAAASASLPCFHCGGSTTRLGWLYCGRSFAASE
jgi:hypothetical protein